CSATRMSPSTMAAGPNGAIAWTYRSIAETTRLARHRLRTRLGTGRDQQLRPMLQPFVQRGDRLDGVDLVHGLVGAERDYPREAQREPRPVTVRADDHIEGD